MQKTLREKTGAAMLIALLIAGLLFINASKFDTVPRSWLALFIGLLCLTLPALFGLKGFKKRPIISFALGAWITLVWVSFYFSKTQNYGFSETLIYTFAAGVALAVSVSSEGLKRAAGHAILLLAVASALWGFYYFPTHGEPRLAGLFLSYEDSRNFFPNAFATFLLIAWPLAFWLYEKLKPWKKIIIVSVLLAALFLTYSRGAWISFVIQLAAFAFMLRGALLKYIKYFALSALLAITLAFSLIQLRNINFSTPSLAEKITFSGPEHATSAGERKEFWLGSLQLIREHPFIGSGPMSFRYAYPRVQKIFLANSDHPHNWILKIAVESGVPAALSFMLFIGILAVLYFKQAFRNRAVLYIGIALDGALLHNLLDFNMNFTINIFAFFILCGILLSHSSSSGAVKNKITENISASIWILILLITSILTLDAGRYAFARKPNPYLLRDTLRGHADELLKRNKNEEAAALLAQHIAKNKPDAWAWHMRGNDDVALAYDSMNRFAYYRASVQEFKNIGLKITESMGQRIQLLLDDYDYMLKANIHYTAFTDNPEEAARIYEILGNNKKALEIRTLAEKVSKEFAAKNFFNKQFGPRHPFDFFIDSKN